MVFKALPVATTGMGVTCEYSILKWHPTSGTWAYVATPGDNDLCMWKVCTLLEAQMPPKRAHGGYVRAHNELMNTQFLDNNRFAKLANGSITTGPCRRNEALSVANNSYAMTGGIGHLRWALEEIK